MFTAAEAGIRDGSSAPVDDGGVWGRVPTTSPKVRSRSFLSTTPSRSSRVWIKVNTPVLHRPKDLPLAVIHRVVLLAGKALTVMYI